MKTHNSAPAPSQAGGSFEGQREQLFADLSPPKQQPVPTRAPAAAPGAPLTFAHCARLGYGQRLIPIIPPDTPISERSSLFKRVGTNQDGRGKTPGVRGRDGNWYGFDWLPHEADERDLIQWAAMCAGVGIKTGNGLVLIDADTLNEAHAAIITKIVEEHFGRLPLRIGRSPKAGYVIRTSELVRYQRVEFGEMNDKGRLIDRVEILSDGRQFVAHGIHPKTRQPYFWPRPLVPFDALPVASASQITAFLEALRPLLPSAKPIVSEGASSAVNQEALKGRPDLVAKAVRAIPNTSEHFPTRESYRDFGYAIKAALPDNEAEAFDLFSDWCARWDDGENDPDIVAADWRRMKPPFRRGAGWLYELAEQHAPEQFNRAEQWFEPPPPPHESLFGESSSAAADRKPRILELVSFDEAAKTALTASAEPLIEGLLDQGTLSVMYAPSNAGKTFVMVDISDAVAAGRLWGGRRTTKMGVLYVAAEGGRGVRKRCAALAKKYPGKRGDFFQLRLASIDLLHPNQDLEPLIETVRQSPVRIGLIVIDTFSRALAGGNENDSVDMGVMVRHLDKIKEATGAHITVLHHTGKDQARGARGHTLLQAAIDTEIEIANNTITVTKQRDLDGSFSRGFVLHPVEIGRRPDGGVVTSAFIDLVETDKLPPGKPTRAESEVLGALQSLSGAAPGEAGVSVDGVVAALREQGKSNVSKESTRKQLVALEKKRLAVRSGSGRWLHSEYKVFHSAFYEEIDGADGDPERPE